jgi:4-carboxymuconolactone decarboxylase
MADVKTETADTLRALSAGDSTVLEGLLGMQLENLEDSGLDSRAYAMCKIAALVALDAPPACFTAQVGFALRTGVSAEEVLGVLIAVAPQVGIARVMATAPGVMLALGVALEEGS